MEERKKIEFLNINSKFKRAQSDIKEFVTKAQSKNNNVYKKAGEETNSGSIVNNTKSSNDKSEGLYSFFGSINKGQSDIINKDIVKSPDEIKKKNTDGSENKTIIGSGVVIDGNISLDDSLEIKGHIKGDIACNGSVFLNSDAVVEGNIAAISLNIISGKIDGNIKCKETISVSNGTIINGNVDANSASISGQINGNLNIAEKVTIGKSSVISGDITADGMSVEHGASISGKCFIGKGE